MSETDDERLPGWQRAYVAACAGIVGFALTYGLVDYAHLSRPFLDAREHAWSYAAKASGPEPMGYFGLWLWAIAAGLAAAGLALLALRLRRRPFSENALTLGLAWAMTAFLLVGAYFTWNNWP